jgi:hypothetical protein
VPLLVPQGSRAGTERAVRNLGGDHDLAWPFVHVVAGYRFGNMARAIPLSPVQ